MVHTPHTPELSPPGSSPCGIRLCTDWDFWSPPKVLVVATLLGTQLLSGWRRRRGNNTGAACCGPGFPGEGAASGGAPGGLAPLPLSCAPEAWTGLSVSARLEEDGDGSLQRGNVEEGPEEAQTLSGWCFFPAKTGRSSHSMREVLGEKGTHKDSQPGCPKTWEYY